MNTTTKKIIIISVVAFIALILLLSSFAIIPTGYTGVRMTFGQISTTPVSPGITVKMPIGQRIIKINNKQQDIEYEDKVWSETAERTAIFYENITVSYNINADKSVWLCTNVSDYNNCVSNILVASAVKTASKKLSAENATNRAIIEPNIAENLQNSLDEKYGEGVIYISKVVVSNVDFEDSYNQAIANKQQTQLEYETQQITNKKAVEKAEADAQVAKTKAEADAQIAITKAKAEADALLIAADAEAKANREISDSLSERLLEKAYYDKWNGELPYVFGSDKNIINIPTGGN